MTNKYLATSLAVVLGACIACARAEEPAASAAPLQAVKVGDSISYAFSKYVQPKEFGDIVLDVEHASTYSATVVADDASGRRLRYGDGEIDLYDKDSTYLGLITPKGEKKMVDAKQILHWKPAGELKPGMHWKISDEWPEQADNDWSDCLIDRDYEASTQATTREIKIGGQLQRVPVILVSLKGVERVNETCEGPRYNITGSIVYAPVLNLVLELDFKFVDPFKNLPKGGSFVETVTAVD